MRPIWAQAPTDLSGATGWVGAGLLGLVLAWLLVRHIPSILQHYQHMIADMLTKHQGETSESRRDYRDTIAQLISQQEKDTSAVLSAFQRESERHSAGLAKLEVVLTRALERWEVEQKRGRHT